MAAVARRPRNSIAIGERNGSLVVAEKLRKQGEYWVYLTTCDCGEPREVISMQVRRVKSCVRCSNVRGAMARTTHGESQTRLYRQWMGMVTRCTNPNATKYRYYGGKGVKICDAWLSYERYAAWARANGYVQGMALDRIDEEGNYCPDNCEFVPVSKNSARMLQKNRSLKLSYMAEETAISMAGAVTW